MTILKVLGLILLVIVFPFILMGSLLVNSDSLIRKHYVEPDMDLFYDRFRMD